MRVCDQTHRAIPSGRRDSSLALSKAAREGDQSKGTASSPTTLTTALKHMQLRKRSCRTSGELSQGCLNACESGHRASAALTAEMRRRLSPRIVEG